MQTGDPSAPLILIVEDNDSHVSAIQRAFKNDGNRFRLAIAGSMNDALVVIDKQDPALVICDYKLPDGDGTWLLLTAKDHHPIILMTSQGNEQIAVDAMKAGAQDYIVKSAATLESLPLKAKHALETWNLVVAHRKIDEAVRRGKRDWERTFDALPDLISIIDINHTIIRVNRSMAEHFGLTPAKLVGRKCCELVHGMELSPASCPVADMAKDGLVHNKEYQEKIQEAFFDITVSPLFDEEGSITAYVHVMRDITERKFAEEERQKLQQQFQQTQKLESLGVLAGGIAHDFNNILTIILGHCYIVDQNIDSGMDQNTHVKHIEKAAGRAASLCHQMLTYSGQNKMVQARINLWLLVDENVKMLQSAIKKNVNFELDLKFDVPEIPGDSAQLQQVVMNLIINAAEAIGDKNGIIKIALRKVTISGSAKQADCVNETNSCSKKAEKGFLPAKDNADTDFLGNAIPAGDYACLAVSDNGCGMEADTQKRLFEPFFTTKFAGRGLGMSAVLGIIKSHHGTLQLSSAPEIGTTFKVYLPLATETDIAETSPQNNFCTSEKGCGTILLVEDEDALRIIGSALLKAMGYTILTAANGCEALEIYRERGSDINLILLDLLMPDMGGIDTYRVLREISPTLPIVICSGYSFEDIFEEVEGDDHAAMIQKPYVPEQLRDILTKFLGKSE